MSRKPYRRFRARRRTAAADGLDELRDLNARGPRGRDRPRAPEPHRSETRAARPGSPPEEPRPEPPAPRDRLRWVSRVAIAVVVLVLAWASLGVLTIRNAAGDARAGVHPQTYDVLDSPPGGMLGSATNTLVVGKDALPGRSVRSRADTILIIRTDPASGRIKYLSIPRDTRVHHPIRGPEKINHSFFFGGQIGVIRAVKRHTGLSIHHIMVVNFRTFPKMVDDLGGVTVNNPTPIENCPYSGGRTVSFAGGPIELDGARALEFARVRLCDSDIQRARRQQALLSAMKSKVLSLSTLPLAPWRGAAVARSLVTDMGTGDMIKFGWLQARLAQTAEDRILLTGSPLRIGGISYIEPDPSANEDEVARFLS